MQHRARHLTTNFMKQVSRQVTVAEVVFLHLRSVDLHFNENNVHLVYLSGLFVDPNPSTYPLDYFIVIDRIMFRILQFLKD